jgi:hypothetical protein
MIKKKIINFFDTTLELCAEGKLNAMSYGGFILLLPLFVLYLYWKSNEI